MCDIEEDVIRVDNFKFIEYVLMEKIFGEMNIWVSRNCFFWDLMVFFVSYIYVFLVVLEVCN